MTTLWNNFVGVFAAVAYYVKAAISVLTSNPVLLVVSVFMILMIGKSFSIGNLVKARG